MTDTGTPGGAAGHTDGLSHDELLRAENARLQSALAEREAALEALAVLLRTSRRIAASIEYDEVLAEVARIAGEALGSPECIVWEFQPRTQRAEFRCLWERDPKPGLAAGLVGSSWDMTTHSGGLEGLRAGTVVQQRRSDPGLDPVDAADMERWGETTWLTVPLVSGPEIIGVLILIETEAERDFTDEERELAAAIGEQAAAALANARQHRRAEERNRWLQALLEAGRAVTSTLDIDELLPAVARLAAKAVGAPVAFIYEYDARRDAFVTRTRYGPEGLGRDDPIGSVTPLSETPDDRLALTDGLVFVETISDPAVHPNVRALMERGGEKTLVNVPFRFQGEALGMLVLIETEAERRFTEDELAFLLAFAEQVAIAFNNARLYTTIEALATVDGLTGLANHRTFYERLEQELARARRYDTPVSLLMIDIDDFKVLNDTWGHQAGDAVLRSLARLLSDALRFNVDIPARYGGEEFAVILPNTPLGRVTRDGAPGDPGDGDCPDGVDDTCMPAVTLGPDEPPPNGHGEGAAALAERLRALVAATEFPISETRPGDAAHREHRRRRVSRPRRARWTSSWPAPTRPCTRPSAPARTWCRCTGAEPPGSRPVRARARDGGPPPRGRPAV